MKPMDYRKQIMKVIIENDGADYWISTNAINDILYYDYNIEDTSSRRVGTNLNLLKRLGYIDRYNTMQLWRLTEKGKNCDLAATTF